MASLVLLDDREGLIRGSPGFSRIAALLGGADAVIVLDAPLSELSTEQLLAVSGARFAMAVRERTRIDAATLARLPALELLLQTGGHAYHIDGDALRSRAIVCALGKRAKRVLSAVPELTLLLILSAMRRLGEAGRALSAPSGEWPPLVGRCLAGKRLGILGLGRHGRNVARLASAFGMEVVAWDRGRNSAGSGSEKVEAPGHADVPRLPLLQLLATSDVVSIHLRLSPESRGLLGRANLQLMKRHSVLVNTARGAIVDEGALIEALQLGPLAAAGLDVFEVEPLPADSPLRSLPNAVLTPHVGWTTEEVFREFSELAAEQLRDYLQGPGLAPEELLDPGVRPRPGALGKVQGVGSEVPVAGVPLKLARER